MSSCLKGIYSCPVYLAIGVPTHLYERTAIWNIYVGGCYSCVIFIWCINQASFWSTQEKTAPQLIQSVLLEREKGSIAMSGSGTWPKLVKPPPSLTQKVFFNLLSLFLPLLCFFYTPTFKSYRFIIIRDGGEHHHTWNSPSKWDLQVVKMFPDQTLNLQHNSTSYLRGWGGVGKGCLLKWWNPFRATAGVILPMHLLPIHPPAPVSAMSLATAWALFAPASHLLHLPLPFGAEALRN